MSKKRHLTILGGGPAGLAAGYWARKHGLSCTIVEASRSVGGNCRTVLRGGFAFDTGAHRLHDRNPAVTGEIRRLPGAELRRVDVGSQIFHNGRLLDFPLSPLNLASTLEASVFLKAMGEILYSVSFHHQGDDSFESFALNTYGKEIAESFLLNYSQKLWGLPCHRLSATVAGKRMSGLSLGALLREALLGKSAKTRHLDGAFYYPRRGIGAIMEALAAACGRDNILTGSRVTALHHDGRGVRAVRVNGRRTIETDLVVGTLRLDRMVRMMDPPLPDRIAGLAERLRYRNLRLAMFALNKESVTGAATVYYPSPEFPFTRMYEPKNRSRSMAPPGKTSLAVELPCQQDDFLWGLSPDELIRLTSIYLVKLGWIRESEIIGAWAERVHDAYPVLELGCEQQAAKIRTHLEGFENLTLCGRNAEFAYAHIHDVLESARKVVAGLGVETAPERGLVGARTAAGAGTA
jgi:protoporphyrinogen oxidase